MECWRRGIFILLYWFNVDLAVICKGDPCTDTDNIKVKQNETWRSPTYSKPNLRQAKCDAAIVEGWYRIESETGNDMTMECVSTYKCGTHFPIWMNGTIPDESEGVVTREVCVSYHLGCCHHKFNINVQNCGDYRVYELIQTAGCAWAYCFGEIPLSTLMPSTTVTSYQSNAFSSTTDTSKETSTRQLSTTRQHTRDTQITTEKPSTTSVRNQPTETSTSTTAVTDAVTSTTRDQTTFSDVSTRKSTGDEDPCSETTKVKLLRGQTWRSAAYREANLRRAKCDAAIGEGWYRVESEAGNDTVTECVPTYMCGTHFPIWMNGTIPNVSEGVVTREMCVSYHLGCCYHKFNINVQNCGDYRVYELTQTAGCAWAYCFGERLITTLKPSTVKSTSTTEDTTTEGERLITTLKPYTVTSPSTTEDTTTEGERLITTLKPSTVTSPSTTEDTTTKGERLITTLELSSVTSTSTTEDTTTEGERLITTLKPSTVTSTSTTEDTTTEGERLITTLKPSSVTSTSTTEDTTTEAERLITTLELSSVTSTSTTEDTTTEGERLITTMKPSSVTSTSTTEDTPTEREHTVQDKGEHDSLSIVFVIVVTVIIALFLFGLFEYWLKKQEGKRDKNEVENVSFSYKRVHNNAESRPDSYTTHHNERELPGGSHTDEYDRNTSSSVKNPIYFEEPHYNPSGTDRDMMNQDRGFQEKPNASSQENPYSEISHSENNLEEYTSYPRDTLHSNDIDLQFDQQLQ